MKKIVALLSLLVVILAAGGVWYARKQMRHRRNTGIQTITAVEGPIEETVDATGEVAPLNRVEIKPPISGRVEKLLVDEGAQVTAGQILAWMSSSDRAAILDAARAQGPEALKHWEDSYKPTPIVAPLSGIVILRNVVVGQTVDPSIVLYAMSDKLIVVAQVDETDIGRVRDGMGARVTLDAYPESPVDGRVFQILHEGKNVSNVITYDVKIEPKTVPSFFRSQMTANVSLVIRREEKAVLIPLAAIRDGRNGSKQVLVPDDEGKPVPQDIEIGIQSGEKAQVTSGLNAGDRIIVSQTKYSPQKGPQGSPLSFGGAKRSGGGGR